VPPLIVVATPIECTLKVSLALAASRVRPVRTAVDSLKTVLPSTVTSVLPPDVDTSIVWLAPPA